ncbi:hypothetical protein [Silvanigrella aquatica]|uniref:Uncharacterized protein n=1 Tax=Silvanigrella aquatica TaxID=1915309 RepID=A0A1L4D2R8_9BACT|nr:hypothetical protein [Silvanigrella aquatica]APJ04481.1 hypothetical protein AXG55_11400 [Silvanigrella aquatica]
MEKSERIYTTLINPLLQNDIRNVIRFYKADRIFNYVDPNIIDLSALECINLGGDTTGLTNHYFLMNIYQIDPFLNQMKYTRKQTFHFKELELSQIKMFNSSVRVGVLLNQERSKYFKVHNGMYRTIQLNRKYCFVCIYGVEKKDFIFDVDFNSFTRQGQWFQSFELALLEVVRKYLIDIALGKRSMTCPILKDY